MVEISMTEPLNSGSIGTRDTKFSAFSLQLKKSCNCGLKIMPVFQTLHFFISMFFLLAGFVEFIKHPPYFDAYGDAKKNQELLPKYFKNDPRSTEYELLRIMDLPILIVLLMYKAVCIWLKYRGYSWLVTLSLLLTFVCFWIVNFGGFSTFEWSHYRTRMHGLQFQVSTIALSATMVFMVIFYSRKKFPFKFKSSVRIKQNSKFLTFWNFFAIYLVMFSSLLVWFMKMYASWAIFTSRTEILQLCSTTTQVECFPCKNLTRESIRICAHEHRHRIFTCSENFADSADQGSFCIFNFNLSVYGFILTFAYIGGICVFMSTFIRIVGHYIVRGLVLVYQTILRLHYRSSDLIIRQRDSLRHRRRKRGPDSRKRTDMNENSAVEPTESYSSDSDDGNGLVNSLIVEFP